MAQKQNISNGVKICFFNSDFPPRIGGIATFNWSLAYHISKAKEVEDVQVVAFKNPKPGQEKFSQKLSIIRLPWFSFLSLAKKVWQYIFRFRNYDVFHATNLFPVGFLLVLLGRFIFKKPVFVSFYGTDVISTQASRKTKLAKYFTLKYASAAMAVSHSTLKEAAKYYQIEPTKFSVIYYCLADKPVNKRRNKEIKKKIRKKYNLSEDDFIVLTVANLVKRKGIADLVKAVSLIDNPRVKLVIVGQGPERENLEKLAKKLNIAERVIFTGLVDEVSPFYTSADIFVLPSFFIKKEGDIEGLGIVLLEAQQYGLPVIGTKSGGIPEAIDNGRSGFVVPERNPRAIKEKILLLADDKELYFRMANRAPQFVQEKFNWVQSVKKYLLLYTSKL